MSLESVHNDNVTFCLRRISASTPGWKTLVVQGSAVTEASPQQVWRVWSDLATWPHWSPLHTATAWAGTPGFALGARFDQTLALGFPVGTKTEQATIAELEPEARAAWAGDSGGIRSCHSWRFTPTASGGTHISNVEAFTGAAVGLVRPLVARPWNRMFQGAVNGLARTAAT
ncbi:SRPBCC family protein [Dactylosporangium cerinum]|uniref:SRPBCC family protein n=1 Tax=Dactylosporangium cerinum TaxID=1434730 RepID=A0ABV9W3M6_9ACTN